MTGKENHKIIITTRWYTKFMCKGSEKTYGHTGILFKFSHLLCSAMA